MRRVPLRFLSLSLAMLWVASGFAVRATAVEKATAATQAQDLSERYQASVIQGPRLIAIRGDGHLVVQDLEWGTTRDYGTLDKKLRNLLAPNGDVVAVADAGAVYEVSLESGAIVRSASFETQSEIGYVDKDTLFSCDGRQLKFIDLRSGKVSGEIRLRTDSGRSDPELFLSNDIAHVRKGNWLILGSGNLPNIVVVDLKKAEVVRRWKTSGSVTGLHLSGERLTARISALGYGILTEHFEVINIVNGEKAKMLNLPSKDKHSRLSAAKVAFGLFPCEEGGFLVAWEDGVYKYDAAGKLVGGNSDALKAGDRLLGSWNRKVLLASGKGLATVKLSAIQRTGQ